MADSGVNFVFSTLKKRAEFVEARRGPSCRTKAFILQAGNFSLEPDTVPRFGFTVTKKVGNAVVRNRIKRRLRETVRECGRVKDIKPANYVLIGKTAALNHSMETMVADLARGLDQVANSRENLQKSIHSKRSGKL